MKKILTIFLTLAVMLTAAACGAKEEGTESSPAPSSAAEESSSEASLPEPGPVPTEVGGEGLALMEQMTAALEGTGDYADNPTASIDRHPQRHPRAERQKPLSFPLLIQKGPARF